jgi:hypothetical protein
MASDERLARPGQSFDDLGPAAAQVAIDDVAPCVIEDEDPVWRPTFGRGLDGESDLDQRAGEQQSVAFEGRAGF